MEAFTVKATYRSETRKFSFPDSVFPTYEQLYSQLYRVFPISHSFYLSKLLFSPNISTHARVLIGKEVHSAEEYDHHVAPYRGRSWPGALLRFAVFDETPHKSPRMSPSSRFSDATSNVSESESATSASAASATTVRPAADPYSHIRGDRRILLDRILERTHNRASFHAMPPTPPASSRPTSMAESSSRPTSLASEPAGWRPLPARPTPSGESAASTTSTRTVRPSLFDLLANTPPTNSVPSRPSKRSSVRVSGPEKSHEQPASKKDGLMSWMEWQPKPPASSDLKLPSLGEVRPPPRPAFVAPPPPILFSRHIPSQSDTKGRTDGDMVMKSSPVRSDPVPPLRSDRKDSTQSLAQPRRSPQLELLRNARPEKLQPGHRSFGMADPQVRPKAEPCCSVEEGKAEVKALMEQFKRDFNKTMVKTFGEDWDKAASPEKSEAPLPHLPSPPTHRPVLPESEPRPIIICPAPPPPSLPVPPPPPPPLFVPPPPPPCIIPPPPFVQGFIPFPASLSSSRSSTPMVPPPPPLPGWTPPESWNQTHETAAELLHGETVHMDVRCDYCGKKNIKGIRYKCLQCADHDWCSACMASPKAWEAHPASHAFFPIHKTEDFLQFCLVKDRRLRRQPTHQGITCDGCQQKNITGVRYKCIQCDDFDFCDACVSSPQTRLSHDVSHVFFPVKEPGMKEAFNKARKQVQQPAVIPPPIPEMQHLSVHCDGCGQYPLSGVRHKCLDCNDYDFCTTCLSNPEVRAKHDSSHAFFPVTVPLNLTEYNKVRASHRRSTADSPRVVNTTQTPRPVHKNIICDICNKQIIGVRHKCLDCADYDLCEDCISNPTLRNEHDAQHQFFAIEKPGEVIVHTIFSGDGEREPARPAQPSSQRISASGPRSRDVEPVVHNAMCNMCDSRIRGDRFKCLNCPDYDVCQLCYRITSEQHPDHGFVKVGEPAMLMIRDTSNDPIHFASCNACGQRIRGIRYKCMHESCPDFDLCENCEAHPIPVHPITHPLLKMRIPGVVVPTLLRTDEVVMPRMVPRPPSSYEYVPAAEQSSPAMPAPTLETIESFVNAPAQPPALPLPEFTPDLHVPSLPPTTTPPPHSFNPFYHPSEVPFVWSSPLVPSPPATFEERCIPIPVPVRLPTPPTPSARLSPPVPEPVVSSPLEQPESIRDLENMFSQVLCISEVPIPEFVVPPSRLVDVDEVTNISTNEGTLGGASTPSEVPTTSASSSKSVPKLGPVNDNWQELWPEIYTNFKHLLHPATPPAESAPTPNREMSMPGAMFPDEPLPVEEAKPLTAPAVNIPPALEESPLVGEPLLCRPLMPERLEKPLSLGWSLNDLIGSARPVEAALPRIPTPPTSIPVVPVVPVIPVDPTPKPSSSGHFWQTAPREVASPTAAFVSDSNIPVGQIFPPGAEFVKSWRMRNDGTVDWPDSTELVFVAGDRMFPRVGSPPKVKIGCVKAGEEVELVSGELKAPEVPGKYVSSWRLSDGNGNLFGNSVWVDITVAEMNETSSDESLASSSVIMPHALPQTTSGRTTTEHRFSSSSMTFPSAPPSEGGSSVSLLDAFSSDSDDDAIYEDSRSRVIISPVAPPVQEAEYVMLFDSSSSSEDD